MSYKSNADSQWPRRLKTDYRWTTRGKTRRSWQQKLQVLLLLAACWSVSGPERLAHLIYHVKDVSSDIILCRCIWNHPRITCPSYLATADRTAPVTITPVRKPEKWGFFIGDLLLAKKKPPLQRTPPTNHQQIKPTQWELQSSRSLDETSGILLLFQIFFMRKMANKSECSSTFSVINVVSCSLVTQDHTCSSLNSKLFLSLNI